MITNTQIRNQILKKIQRIPADRLKELEVFVSKLEETTNKKAINLSFSGAWENIDDDLFSELTDNLIDKRQRTKRRINE